MTADLFAWIPERARFAAARLGFAWSAAEPTSLRIILGSVWIGEGEWCYVDSGSEHELPRAMFKKPPPRIQCFACGDGA